MINNYVLPPHILSSEANTKSFKRDKDKKILHLTMGAGFAPVTMQTRVKF